MNLLAAALLIVCILSPGLVLDNDSKKPGSSSNVLDFAYVEIRTTSDFKLDLMSTQDFIDWMNHIVKSLTGMVGGPYKPTKDEEFLIVRCYFHRFWERKHLSDLTPKDEFCKRLSENKPNDLEKHDSHRFDTFLKLWDSMKEIDKIKFAPYNLTDGEMIEVEDCHFYRYWEYKPDPTEHDLFCRRLSDNEPNDIEALEKMAFEAYRNAWHNMTVVAAQDFAQVSICVLVEGKLLEESPEHPCTGFSELIANRNSWRDIRREQVLRCMRKYLKNRRRSYCNELVKRYKEVYCGGNC